MRLRASSLLLLSFFMPTIAIADGDSISRRDGFLMIWESIKRPVGRITEEPFTDTEKGSLGFAEITYAKDRGILGGQGMFHPDDALTFEAAFLWLLRSRNVDAIDRLQPANVDALLRKYSLERAVRRVPSSSAGPERSNILSKEQLRTMINALDSKLINESHEVSLYSEKFHGKGTGCGETFDMHALTAAHKYLPCNTMVRVTNPENGLSVTVRINDRGPYVDGRDMDLSLASFTTIAERSKGKIQARFERLGDTTLVGDTRTLKCLSESAYRRLQKRLERSGHQAENGLQKCAR